MTDDPLNPLDPSLREAGWRRKLTAAEQQALGDWLASHPEAHADLDAEAGLTEALQRLPDPPLASNFTARVLQAVQRDALVELKRKHSPGGWWRRWLPRTALACLFAAAALGIRYQHELHQKQQLADAAAKIAEMTSLPGPELLQDFDAIRALKTAPLLRSDPRKTTPAADEQLLSLLQ